MLTFLFSLPAHSLYQWMIQSDSTWLRAMGHTTTTVPALLRVQNDGWLALLRIWYQYIHLAYIHACITSIANLWVKYHWPARSRHIWGSVYFFPFQSHHLRGGYGFVGKQDLLIKFEKSCQSKSKAASMSKTERGNL